MYCSTTKKGDIFRKIIGIILVIAMLITIQSPMISLGDSGDDVEVSDTQGLIAAIDDANTVSDPNPTTIIVASNITLTELISVPANKKIILRGKNGNEKILLGNSLTSREISSAQNSKTDAVIMVSGNLTLEDIEIDANHIIRCMSVLPAAGATLTLNSGATVANGYLGTFSNGGACIRVQTATSASLAGKLIMNTGSKVIGGRCNGAYAVSGIGIHIAAFGEFEMNGGEISDNRDIDTANRNSMGAGLFLANELGNFEMSGGEIKNNYARGSGGGVHASSGEFNFTGGEISNNTSLTGGGGIFTQGVLTISGGLIKNNTVRSSYNAINSGSGGGLFIDTSGTVTFNSGLIKGNIARYTGTINPNTFSYAQGGGVYALGKLTMNGGEISENSALSDANLAAPVACGGGVAVPGGREPGGAAMTRGSIRGTFYENGGVIKNNTAQNYGGGVFVSYEERSSEATGGAGQILAFGRANYHLSGEVVINENSNSSGSDNLWLMENTAVYIADELGDNAIIKVDGQDKSLGSLIAEPSNDYTLSASDARRFSDNSGRKVYSLSDGNVVRSDEFTGEYTKLTNINTSITSIADQVFAGQKITPEPDVTFEALTLTKDIDYSISYKNNIDAGTATIKITGKGEYDGSVSTTFNILPKPINDAGVIVSPIKDKVHFGNPVTTKVKISLNEKNLVLDEDYELIFSNNTSPGTATVTINGIGNFSGSRSENFTIIDSTGLSVVSDEAGLLSAITNANGTSLSPTPIYINGVINASATIQIPAAKYISFIGNTVDSTIKATSGVSNCMIQNEGTVSFEEIILDGNSRVLVLQNQIPASLKLLDDCILTGGRSSYGGGINNEGEIIIDGAIIQKNSKPTVNTNAYGGGIYNSIDGSIEIIAGEISENTSNNGGGIYNLGNLEISGGLISNNSAIGNEENFVPGKGGGIYNFGELTMSGGSIDSNTSTIFGGGLFNAKNAIITGGFISKNQAERNGGGIYTTDSLVFEGGKIEGNKVASIIIQRVNNCGGGVFVAQGSFEMSGGEIINNSALSTYYDAYCYASLGNGAGVYVSNDREKPCVFTMSDGIISGNNASSKIFGKECGHGGGVFVEGGESTDAENAAIPGTFNMTGGEITNNTSTDTGNGVFVNNREESVNGGSFTIPFTVYSLGEAKISLSGGAKIIGNKRDNLFLTEGVVSETDSAFDTNLADIGVFLQAEGDSAITAGVDDYILTENDASIFSSSGIRSVQLDSSNNEIILKAVELEDDFSILLSDDSFVYSNSSIKPTVTVQSLDASQTLVEDVDYYVSFNSDTTNVGTKTVTVYGKGEYTGQLQANYTITPKSITEVKASVPKQIYKGSAVRPVSDIEVNDGSISLLRGDDYRILTYSDNNDAGIGKVTIEGNGNYSGELEISFIIQKDFSDSKSTPKLSISNIKTYAFTGKYIAPKPLVKENGKTLVRNVDYSLTYKNNVKTGSATLTITGKGNYCGSKSVKFNIVPKKPTISKVSKSGSKALKVVWKKDAQATGYQIRLSTDKKFKKGNKLVNVTSNKISNKTIKKLKAKKTYYVQIKSYKTIGGKKFYGSWSTAKKMKTK